MQNHQHQKQSIEQHVHVRLEAQDMLHLKTAAQRSASANKKGHFPGELLPLALAQAGWKLVISSLLKSKIHTAQIFEQPGLC